MQLTLKSITQLSEKLQFDLTFIETFFRVVLYIKTSVCRIITQAKDGAIDHLNNFFKQLRLDNIQTGYVTLAGDIYFKSDTLT